MTTSPLTAADLPQERRLVTAIPGPKSAELQARRTSAVSAGVGATLPVYVEAAGGGVIVDIDGNSLIDLGSGIAVTSVGNSAPKGRSQPKPTAWVSRAISALGSANSASWRATKRCASRLPLRRVTRISVATTTK